MPRTWFEYYFTRGCLCADDNRTKLPEAGIQNVWTVWCLEPGITGREPLVMQDTERSVALRKRLNFVPFSKMSERIASLPPHMVFSKLSTFSEFSCAKGPLCKMLNLEKLSGRRVSNSRPTAWEAVALPTELHPQVNTSLPLA